MIRAWSTAFCAPSAWPRDASDARLILCLTAVSPGSTNATRIWLLGIARALERWPSGPLDTLAREITSTPVGAMLYLAAGIPLRERAAVFAVMPMLSDQFAAAARQIRQAADTVP